MSQPSLDSVNRYCRDLAGRSRDVTDRELLARFAATHDAAAFAVLLDRHGPMVRGVCRRILRDDHAVDDVFQAVFLILAEKAGALQRGELLANWLFGVARRMAWRAKRQAGRAQRRERVAAEARPEAVSPPAWDDLLAVLEEELQRLPAKFRGPLLACYHQGRTQDEAAGDFGWHVRTLRRRLAKGREMLRSRMERRGATLTAGLFAAALAPSVADAALPAAIRDATLAAVLGGPASEPVRAMVRGGLKMLALTKLKVWVGIGLIVSAILTAGGIAWRGAAPNLEAKPADPPPAVAAQPPRSDDPLPDGAVARLGTLRLRHGSNNTYQNYVLAFGPDDKTLLSGGDQFLRQWQISDGAEKNAARFDSKLLPGTTLTTADGKLVFQIVASEKSATVHVFDTVAWKKVREVELTPHPAKGEPTAAENHDNTWARCFVVAPDGSWIGTVTGSRRFATWDSTTGKHSQTIGDTGSNFMKVTVAPDAGSVVALDVGKGSIQIWDLKTKMGRPIVLGGDQLSVTNDSPWVISPDGKTLAVATLANSTTGVSRVVRLIPINEGGAERILELPKLQGPTFPTVLTVLAFTPDGKALVYAANGAQAEWGLLPIDGKEPVRHPAGPLGTIFTLALSHDGKTVATCSGYGVIRLWDAATGKERPQPDGHRGAVTAVALTSGETAVTAGADGTIRHWDTATGKPEVKTISDGGFPQMTLSPNGRWLVRWRFDGGRPGGYSGPRTPIASGLQPEDFATAQILDTGTGEERYRLKIPRNWDFRFEDAGNSLVTVERDGTLKQWDLRTGKKERVGVQVASGLHRIVPDRRVADDIVVTVDQVCVGTHFMAGKDLFRWSLLQANVFEETLGQDHAESVTDAAISPDAATIALGVRRAQSAAGRVVLCELRTGKILHEFDVGGSVPSILAFSPDGKMLVAAAGATVRVWDAASGKLTRTLAGHRGKIEALAFDRTGKWLATASADTTALIWDMSK